MRNFFILFTGVSFFLMLQALQGEPQWWNQTYWNQNKNSRNKQGRNKLKQKVTLEEIEPEVPEYREKSTEPPRQTDAEGPIHSSKKIEIEDKKNIDKELSRENNEGIENQENQENQESIEKEIPIIDKGVKKNTTSENDKQKAEVENKPTFLKEEDNDKKTDEEGVGQNFTNQTEKKFLRDIELYHLVAQLLWYKKTNSVNLFNVALKKITKDYPNSDESFYFRALEAQRLGKNALALSYIDSAIQIRNEFARAWNLKGVILSESERNEQALDCFEMAVHIDKFDPDYMYNYSFSLYKLKRYEPARLYVALAIENKPNSASAYYLQGILYHKNGELLKALSSFTLAEEFGQEGDIFYLDYLEVAMKLNKDKETLRLVEILYKADLSNIDILRMLIKANQRVSEYAKALALQKRLFTHSTSLKFEDYKDYVYTMVNIGRDPQALIQGFHVDISQKEELNTYSKLLKDTIQRRKLLKTKDQVLRTKKSKAKGIEDKKEPHSKQEVKIKK